MINWFVYSIIAATIFLIVWLAICCAAQWNTWENATPEGKKKWMRRPWMMGLLLLVAVILFMIAPLHVIVSVFIVVPLSGIILLIIYLIRYCLAKSRQRKDPEAVTAEELASRRRLAVVSSVFLGVATVVIVGFGILVSQGLAFM